MNDLEVSNQRKIKEAIQIDSYSVMPLEEQKKELAELEQFDKGMIATYGKTPYPSHCNLIFALQGLINSEDK